MMFDGLDADRRGEVRLACARAANQDNIGVLRELAELELSERAIRATRLE